MAIALISNRALLVVPKMTKTKYARVYFLADGSYVNISPKALGLKRPPGDLFWDATHQRLCVLGGGGMLTVPWEGIKAERRQKIK